MCKCHLFVPFWPVATTGACAIMCRNSRYLQWFSRNTCSLSQLITKPIFTFPADNSFNAAFVRKLVTAIYGSLYVYPSLLVANFCNSCGLNYFLRSGGYSDIFLRHIFVNLSVLNHDLRPFSFNVSTTKFHKIEQSLRFGINWSQKHLPSNMQRRSPSHLLSA